MSIEPNATYGNGAVKHIVLAGRSYPIPPLAIKQLRHVVPAVLKVIPSFVGLTALQAGADWRQYAAALAQVDNQTIEALTEMVFWSLTRAHPKLTRAEFDDMEVGLRELIDAIPVIVDATGLVKQEKGGEVAPEGESQPIPANPQTGTAS